VRECLRRPHAPPQAERAFFHRSVLSLLYFPGEHKLAVYMPLCAPLTLALPLTPTPTLPQP